MHFTIKEVNMFHKITIRIVRKFLKKMQTWVDKTPGVISVSMDIGDRDIVLAKKTHGTSDT